MKELGKYFTSPAFFGSLAIVIALIAALTFIKNVLIKQVAYKNGKKKRNTGLGMIFNILQYIVIIAALFGILSVNGINVTALVAGLGIVATIVGLSLQDTFKDLFAGLNIFENNFYKVGDYVKYNGELCEVKFFNARITKFSSLFTNSTYTVSNSTISSIEKIKNSWAFEFAFDFEDDRDKITKALKNTEEAVLRNVEGVDSVQALGIININARGVIYAIVLKCKPKYYIPGMIEIYSNAYNEFKKAGVIPSFQQDINIKNNENATFEIRTKQK